MTEQNYYQKLNLPEDADSSTIRRTYAKIALRYIPDNQDTGDAGVFKAFQAVYEVLSDPDKKTKYDQELRSAREKLNVQPESDYQKIMKFSDFYRRYREVAVSKIIRDLSLDPKDDFHFKGANFEYINMFRGHSLKEPSVELLFEVKKNSQLNESQIQCLGALFSLMTPSLKALDESDPNKYFFKVDGNLDLDLFRYLDQVPRTSRFEDGLLKGKDAISNAFLFTKTQHPAFQYSDYKEKAIQLYKEQASWTVVRQESTGKLVLAIDFDESVIPIEGANFSKEDRHKFYRTSFLILQSCIPQRKINAQLSRANNGFSKESKGLFFFSDLKSVMALKELGVVPMALLEEIKY